MRRNTIIWWLCISVVPLEVHAIMNCGVMSVQDHIFKIIVKGGMLHQAHFSVKIATFSLNICGLNFNQKLVLFCFEHIIIRI